MKSCGFLLRIFLAIFLGMCVFSCNCEAESVCPPRAVGMLAPEGVKCVCQDAFYGEKCQFRGHEEVNDEMNGNKEEGIMKGVAVLLRLNKTFSWEIRLMFEGNKNKSAAIFIDPPTFRAYALQKNSTNNNSSEAEGCPFYRCPEKAIGFIKFFEDFNKPCFNKGMIIGVAIGVIATVIVSAVIYSVIRLCSRFCCKKKPQFHQSSGPRNEDTASPKFSCESVIIDIPDEDTLQKRPCIAESQDATSVKSLFITIPEVTNIVPKSASVLW
ncbi:Hypothetical predicted protein [Paramuricea clavata]|uniref:Uncharacterized protein n=1 Tax=Paramuricea clavata TaxID=317549 RepID=A0A6S7JBR1_PARCT|nr:Hypothetical predicted protein [Paramuricea clavata]